MSVTEDKNTWQEKFNAQFQELKKLKTENAQIEESCATFKRELENLKMQNEQEKTQSETHLQELQNEAGEAHKKEIQELMAKLQQEQAKSLEISEQMH